MTFISRRFGPAAEGRDDLKIARLPVRGSWLLPLPKKGQSTSSVLVASASLGGIRLVPSSMLSGTWLPSIWLSWMSLGSF